jgi:hypothetical protein
MVESVLNQKNQPGPASPVLILPLKLRSKFVHHELLQFSKAVEGLNAEMLWTMMYIYGNLDYPVVVVSDLRIKSNESLGAF